MNKIFITTSSFGKFSSRPYDQLKEEGLEVEVNPHGRALNVDETIDFLQGSIGCIAGTEKYTEDVLGSLNELKVISRVGAGVDSIDLVAAQKNGITVVNTPDAPTLAVSEMAVALTFNLMRNIIQSHEDMRKGIWKKRMGNHVSGSKIGIVGFGRIGKKTAELFHKLGSEVFYYDPVVTGNHSDAVFIDFEHVLETCDIIILHASGLKTIIGPDELAKIKPGGLLINLARGEAVDEEALNRALLEGSIGGAAVDVYREEPYSGPLLESPNIILTPHIGSSTIETRIRMEQEAVDNLIKCLKGA